MKGDAAAVVGIGGRGENMKYFTKKLWALTNLGDAQEKQAAYAQWEENLRCYEEYISAIKNKKANAFLKSLERHNGLHDYDVEFIRYNVCRNTCDIRLNYCGKGFLLHFFGVSGMRADMGALDMDFPKLRWGYHEIELLEDKKWRFSVIFDWENELEVVADGARLKELDETDDK